MTKDNIKKFKINDSFFGRYEELVRDVVIPYQEKALKDEILDAEKSHCIENFKLAAQVLETGKCDSEFYGMVFQDSDVAKWLEGAAYSLAMYPNPDLESRCDGAIDIIGKAQHPDGYLNTYFTVKEPDKRWTNLEEAHELYCAGHMMEAAVAYAQCTGKTKLLDIMCKMSDHIYEHFIVNKAEGYPGHPEVELALMRMYSCTGNKKYYELAKRFVDVRGVDSDYFVKESQRHNWTVWGNNPYDKEYTQCNEPVRNQKKATGHSVRAVYLYAGMADVAIESNDDELKNACKTLWNNINDARMYITGGIGSAYEGEAFTKDYHLPNNSAYAETCASIGLIFFANRMLEIERNSKYADTMERALYNTVLAGMQLDGQRFFYVNPLEIIPGISGEAKTHHHTLPQRPKWFTCACCPPNVARLLPSIANYAWHVNNETVFSNLYIGGEFDLTDKFDGKIQVETGYPYNGDVVYKFVPNKDAMKMTLAIRIPSWSKNTAITLNGKEATCDIKDGYAYINGEFGKNDVLTASFDMSVRKIYSSEKVNENSGKVAFSRGPLVYCVEGVDNEDNVFELRIDKNATGKAQEYNPDKLNGTTEIKVDGYRIKGSNTLYSYDEPKAEKCEITLVPYYTWGNRGLNQMRVWIPEI